MENGPISTEQDGGDRDGGMTMSSGDGMGCGKYRRLRFEGKTNLALSKLICGVCGTSQWLCSVGIRK